MRFFWTQLARQDYAVKESTSLVTVLALLRHAGIFGRFLTFRIFVRH
jgi:hypothetical protein